jgi:hypothetical protein
MNAATHRALTIAPLAMSLIALAIVLGNVAL